MYVESSISDDLPTEIASQSDTFKSWVAISGLILITVICIAVNLGVVLRVLFPLTSLAVGIFLYLKQPALYVGFTWWIYFLTPFIARLADQQGGWDPSRTMMVSPFLMTLISAVTAAKYFASSYSRGGSIFILPIIGLIYAYMISFIYSSPFVATKAFLDWLTPILFGFHLFSNWKYYPQFRQTTQRTFLWGALIMGGYGIFQFLVLPDWDKSWIIDSGMTSSAGNPEPFEIRVWSTLNSPGPFGNMMMVALLILPSCRSALYIPATVVGFLSMLLSLVRSAWGGWAIGMIAYFPNLKIEAKFRLLVGVIVIFTCLLPLTTMEQFNTHISGRMETLYNLEEDDSYNSRKEMTSALMGRALTEVLGRGFSSENIDSGIIEMLLCLGWIGTFLYLAGLFSVLNKILFLSGMNSDPFVYASRAVCISLISQIVFGVSFKGVGGMPFWGFAGLVLGAQKYHQFNEEKKRLALYQDLYNEEEETGIETIPPVY
jgi:hypothetical protein